jgi:hypothetical protein
MRAGALAAVIAMVLAAPAASAKPVSGRKFGIGLQYGQPSAVTGYYSLGDTIAVDLAVGWISPNVREFLAHTDLHWLFAEVNRGKDVSLPFYVGAGAWVIDDHSDWFGGLRIPLGIAVHMHPVRLQLFLEVSLQVALFKARETPRSTDTEAAVGIRFFF